MTVEAWWQQFWVQALGGAAGALIVAALLSALSQKVRDKVWNPLGRGLRRLPTVRLTTTGRVAAAREAADRELRSQRTSYERALGDAARDLETAQVRIAALKGYEDSARAAGFEAGRAVAAAELRAAKARADAEEAAAASARGKAAESILKKQSELDQEREVAREAVAEKERQIDAWVEEARRLGIAKGRADAEYELQQQRAELAPRPVWRIRDLGIDAGEVAFSLMNSQTDVAGLEDVWIEPEGHTFAFSNRSQWAGAWPGRVVCRGERMGAGRSAEIMFTVHYRDANGDWRAGRAVLAAPPVPHVGGRVARISTDDPLGPFPRF